MGDRQALVLLQQAAVNAASQQLGSGGLLAINGPPGTGKTTLLRDVVARVIVERAAAMAAFSDPSKAFKPSGEKVPTGGSGFWQIYKVNESIKGHEMLVASTNNGAVENVTRELPSVRATGRAEANYFRTVSDAVARTTPCSEGERTESEPTWGLIAAALGNMRNRASFAKSFWWDPDASMRLYLRAAKGDAVVIEQVDESTGKVQRSLPSVITKEQPPPGHEAAIGKWNAARQRFLALQSEVNTGIAEVEKIRQCCRELCKEREHLSAAQSALGEAGRRYSEALPDGHRFKESWPDASTLKDDAKTLECLLNDKRSRPHWVHRFLKLAKGRRWADLENAWRHYRSVDARIETLAVEVEAKRPTCGRLIDSPFFLETHEEQQGVIPWLPDSLHRKREDLFLAALDVHKAFIGAAAQKLMHNLSVLMNVMSSRSGVRNKSLLADLWSSLFLIVPVVSTAFASVRSMFDDLPPESLGWLLIDEAGQASPQAAVGAMLRAKRAVVLGDPIQIPPVVTLPPNLAEKVCGAFSVDSDRWAAPAASVQSLADAVSPFQSTFPAESGSRSVGLPLLVHRRCEEPMFSISNKIAYGDLMVNQVRPSDGGPIRRALGPARWIKVEGRADTKWCADEGNAVVGLLRQIQSAGVVSPDLFVISPFRIVAQEMRLRLQRERVLLRDLGLDTQQFTSRCVGTIHTFQGREADTVLLLLGAPEQLQHGARTWAGYPPNLLNVAVSRAKRNLYVIGSFGAWAGSGCFSHLAARMSEGSEGWASK